MNYLPTFSVKLISFVLILKPSHLHGISYCDKYCKDDLENQEQDNSTLLIGPPRDITYVVTNFNTSIHWLKPLNLDNEPISYDVEYCNYRLKKPWEKHEDCTGIQHTFCHLGKKLYNPKDKWCIKVKITGTSQSIMTQVIPKNYNTEGKNQVNLATPVNVSANYDELSEKINISWKMPRTIYDDLSNQSSRDVVEFIQGALSSLQYEVEWKYFNNKVKAVTCNGHLRKDSRSMDDCCSCIITSEESEKNYIWNDLTNNTITVRAFKNGLIKNGEDFTKYGKKSEEVTFVSKEIRPTSELVEGDYLESTEVPQKEIRTMDNNDESMQVGLDEFDTIYTVFLGLFAVISIVSISYYSYNLYIACNQTVGYSQLEQY